MKKTGVMWLMLFFTGMSMGQDFEGKIIGGITASQIDGDLYGGFNKFGLMLGGATNFYVSEQLSVQEELVYYMRGSHSSPNDFFSWSLRTNYVDVNVLANYYFTEAVYVQAGPTIGVLVNASQNSGFGSSPFSEMSRINIAGTMGVGYKFSDTMAINLRGMYSVTSASSLRWPFHHNSIGLSVHYFL